MRGEEKDATLKGSESQGHNEGENLDILVSVGKSNDSISDICLKAGCPDLNFTKRKELVCSWQKNCHHLGEASAA